MILTSLLKSRLTIPLWNKQYPEPLRVHVKEVFRNRAQGTFLWVGVVAKTVGEI